MKSDREKLVVVNPDARLNLRVGLEIKTLLKNGYSIEVINWERNQNVARDEIENVLYRYVKLKASHRNISLLFYLPLLYRKLWKKIKNEEIAIIHCTHLSLLPFGVFYGKKKKARVVYNASEMYAINFSRYFPFFSNSIKRLVEIIENWLVSKVDCVLTVDSIKGFLAERYRKHNSEVTVIYNVPDSEPVLDLMTLKELQEKYKKYKVLVYVGGVFGAKGFMKALRASTMIKKEIPNFKLFFIGSFQERISSIKRAFSYIRSHSLEENIEVIPWLPFQKMWYYLKIAQVGLALYQPVRHYLYVSKGNGRKFFTYMLASLPIVGPDFGEVGQVVREEGCGLLVDVTDPEQISKAIIHLLKHPQEARDLGQRGRKAVEEKYNWDMEKRKLLRAYQRIEPGVSRGEKRAQNSLRRIKK